MQRGLQLIQSSVKICNTRCKLTECRRAIVMTGACRITTLILSIGASTSYRKLVDSEVVFYRYCFHLYTSYSSDFFNFKGGSPEDTR